MKGEWGCRLKNVFITTDVDDDDCNDDDDDAFWPIVKTNSFFFPFFNIDVLVKYR